MNVRLRVAITRQLFKAITRLFVFNSNVTFIVQDFRDNDVFLQTGNDVIVIYIRKGAPYEVFGNGF